MTPDIKHAENGQELRKQVAEIRKRIELGIAHVWSDEAKVALESQDAYIIRLEHAVICLSHILEMGHLTPGGSTEAYTKKALQHAGWES